MGNRCCRVGPVSHLGRGKEGRASQEAGDFQVPEATALWVSPRPVFPSQALGSRPSRRWERRPAIHLLQAACEGGPLHIPGGLVARILLLQPLSVRRASSTQLRAQLLKQRLEAQNSGWVSATCEDMRAALHLSRVRTGAWPWGGSWYGAMVEICTVRGRVGPLAAREPLGRCC